MPIVLSYDLNTDLERCLLRFADSLNTIGFTKQGVEEAKKVDIHLTTKALVLKNEDRPSFTRPDSWAVFRKKYSKGYYEISFPIINKPQNRIVISINYYCGELCGWGKTEIYEKTTRGWRLAKTMCKIIS